MRNKTNKYQVFQPGRERRVVKSKIKVVRINEEEFQISMTRVIAEYDIMKAKELDSRNRAKEV